MLGFRPSNMERASIDTVLGSRGDKRIDVDGMDIRLGGSNKARPHAHAGCASGQRSGHCAAGANAAGSENRNLGHGVEHLAKEMHEPHCAANMTTRLDPLRDNHIASDSCRLPGLVGRPDLPRCQRTLLMDNPDELRTRIAVEELDNPADLGSLLNTLVRAGLRRGAARSDNEVYSEWATGQFPRTMEKGGESRWIEAAARGPEHA